MKNKFVLFVVCISLYMAYTTNAQIVKDNVLWVTFPSGVTVCDSSYTSDKNINEIFAKHKVTSIIAIFPFAKSKFLQNTYQVDCSSAEGLYNEIQKNANLFTNCEYSG